VAKPSFRRMLAFASSVGKSGRDRHRLLPLGPRVPQRLRHLRITSFLQFFLRNKYQRPRRCRGARDDMGQTHQSRQVQLTNQTRPRSLRIVYQAEAAATKALMRRKRMLLHRRSHPRAQDFRPHQVARLALQHVDLPLLSPRPSSSMPMDLWWRM